MSSESKVVWRQPNGRLVDKPAEHLSDAEDSEYGDWEDDEFEDAEFIVEYMTSDQETLFERRLHT